MKECDADGGTPAGVVEAFEKAPRDLLGVDGGLDSYGTLNAIVLSALQSAGGDLVERCWRAVRKQHRKTVWD